MTNADLRNTGAWERLKGLWETYGSLALPVKMIVGAFITLFAGPGILGFLNEYATYNYAIQYGFRPPLEGIPYLRTAVTVTTFLLLLFGAAVFLLSMELAAKAVKQIDDMFGFMDDMPEPARLGFRAFRSQFRRQPLRVALIAAAATGAVIAVGTYIFLYLRNATERWPPTLALGTYGIVVVLLMWNERASWFFAAAMTVAGFAFAVFIMFDVPSYACFLRFSGYGGGLHVSVDLAEDGGRAETISAALMLRTSEAIILYDPAASAFREVPLSEVRSVRHDAKPLHEQVFTLPKRHGISWPLNRYGAGQSYRNDRSPP